MFNTIWNKLSIQDQLKLFTLQEDPETYKLFQRITDLYKETEISLQNSLRESEDELEYMRATILDIVGC